MEFYYFSVLLMFRGGKIAGFLTLSFLCNQPESLQQNTNAFSLWRHRKKAFKDKTQHNHHHQSVEKLNCSILSFLRSLMTGGVGNRIIKLINLMSARGEITFFYNRHFIIFHVTRLPAGAWAEWRGKMGRWGSRSGWFGRQLMCFASVWNGSNLITDIMLSFRIHNPSSLFMYILNEQQNKRYTK